MTLSIIFMFVSAALCILVPATAAIAMIIRRKANPLIFVLGVVSFTVSQLLLRIPIFEELHKTAWFSLFSITQPVLYVMLLALSAGVFEESGRYVALRFMKTDLLTWENGVVFGLGHGGMEAFWLVGLQYINMITAVLAGEHTAEVLNTASYFYLIGGIERILAVLLHIGFTMLVLYAVKRRNIWFFLLAVLFHFSVNAIAVIIPPMEPNTYYLIVEGIIAVFAALALFITFKVKPKLKSSGSRKG